MRVPTFVLDIFRINEYASCLLKVITSSTTTKKMLCDNCAEPKNNRMVLVVENYAIDKVRNIILYRLPHFSLPAWGSGKPNTYEVH